MHKAFRYDAVQMSAPEHDDKGYLHVDAKIARTGIQEYMMPDGSKRRELRPEDEVFNKDSLESLKGTHVTNEHPPMPLDSKNTKTYSVGHLDGEPETDEKFVHHHMVIHDDRAIHDVLEGGKNQISQGYMCDIEMTPGEHPEHGPYDGIQRNIRHNHSAIVKDGRAGPEVAIKMDSTDGKPLEVGYSYRIDMLGDYPFPNPDMHDEDEDEGMEEDMEGCESAGEAHKVSMAEEALEGNEEELEEEENEGPEEGEEADAYDEDEEGIEEDAQWSTKVKNALPKSSFAYVDPEGKGHFPYKNAQGEIDLPHLRNALARAPQSPLGEKAMPKLKAAAKKAGVGEYGKEKKDRRNLKPVAKLNKHQGDTMSVILKLDNLELQFPENMASAVQVISKELAKIKKLRADNKDLATRLDAAEKKVCDLNKIVSDEKEMQKLVQERVDTLDFAKKVFPKETKMDEISTLDLQKKVVAQLSPTTDLTKVDEKYVKGLMSGLMLGYKTDDTKKLEEQFKTIKTDDSIEGKIQQHFEGYHKWHKDAHKGAKPEEFKVK